MPRAFVLGGAGQVGRAVASTLARAGWEVTAASRRGTPVDGASSIAADRDAPGGLSGALEDGADLLVDCVCYDERQAEQLLAVADRVGRLTVLSSVSVYADERGRSLDEATGPHDFPIFPVPITEDQPTVPPGPQTYSTRKVAMERRLLRQDAVPVTVLRPGAIHGPHSVHAREWYFVKRALDRRPAVLLAYGGGSQFHPTGVTNLGVAVLCSSQHAGQDVFNLVDPDCPTVSDIGRAIGEQLDYAPVEVLMPGPPHGTVGNSPWTASHPLVVSTAHAESVLGYSPSRTYSEQLRDDVAWLLRATARRDWRTVLPDLVHNYPLDFFDYAAERRYLDNVAGSA